MQVTQPLSLRVEQGARPELDLRHLPSPEPMLLAPAAADALQPGESLHVLTPLLPIPLLDALAISPRRSRYARPRYARRRRRWARR